MKIRIVAAYDHPQEIKALFSEYTQMLIEGDPSFQQYLDIQHYDDEINHLESKYGEPFGRLYLAYLSIVPAKQDFKSNLKNASILYLFYEILLGSEQLYFIRWNFAATRKKKCWNT